MAFLKIVIPSSVIYLLLFFGMNLVPWLNFSMAEHIIIGCLVNVSVLAVGYVFLRILENKIEFYKTNRWLFIVGLLVIGLTPWRQLRPPDGDAPHYLIAASSLFHDHDLLTENNYAQRDHIQFDLRRGETWELPDVRHRPNRNGKMQFWYSVGTPLINALLVAIPNSGLVNYMLACLIFLGLYLLWNMQECKKDWIRAILYGCAPVVFFTAQVFPDDYAFLLVSLVLFDTYSSHKYDRVMLWLSLLPWFKPNYSIISFFWFLHIILMNKWYVRKHFLKVFRLALLPMISCISLCSYNYYCWGSFSVLANYPPLSAMAMSVKNIVPELGRFIFGFAGGIFWGFPLLLLVLTIRVKRLFSLETIAITSMIIVFVSAICSTPFSEAGWCPRGRYFLPILPIAIYAIDQQRTRFTRLTRVLSYTTVIFTIPSMIFPEGNLPWAGLNAPFSMFSHYCLIGNYTQLAPWLPGILRKLGSSLSIPFVILLVLIITGVLIQKKLLNTVE